MPPHIVHKNVTQAVLAEINTFSNRFIDGVLDGVVDPDKNPDWIVEQDVEDGKWYRKQHPHHSRCTMIIDYYFDLSLYYLRKGDEYKAGFMLGRAFHYAQDESFKKQFHDVKEKFMIKLISNHNIKTLCRNIDAKK